MEDTGIYEPATVIVLHPYGLTDATIVNVSDSGRALFANGYNYMMGLFSGVMVQIVQYSFFITTVLSLLVAV